MFQGKYGLASTTLFTVLLKGSLFVIGIAIIGVFEPRTIVGACFSTTPSSVQVYQFLPWPHIEAYTDYRDLYLPCLITPFLHGETLYHFTTIVYNYPPLFLYLVGGFAYLANVIWVPAIPLVLFDILTVIPLYYIAKEFVFHGNEKMAFVVSLFWAANPINLFYNDLMWLNTAPTTFFLVLAIYLFLKQKWLFSSLCLAISTGFKQISVILFPVLLIVLWRVKGFSKDLAFYTVAYVLSLLLISTPYVFTNPQNYFWSLNFPIFGVPSNVRNVPPPSFSLSLSEPVRITTFFGLFSNAAAQLVSESYGYLDYVLGGAFIVFLVYIVLDSLYLKSPLPSRPALGRQSALKSLKDILTYAGAFVLCLSRKQSEVEEDDMKEGVACSTSVRMPVTKILVWCLVAFLIFYALFGRGIYKYYFATITPLGFPFFKNRFGAAIFEVLSVVLLLVPREATPWFAVLMLVLLPQILEVQPHISAVTVQPSTTGGGLLHASQRESNEAP